MKNLQFSSIQIVFKIKTGYKLELLTKEIQKLLRN